MKIQRAFCAALLLWIIGIASVSAQSMPAVILSGGCGTGKANTGSLSYLTVDTTLKLCVNATVSASITGFPTVQSTGTPISVTTGGVTGTLPTGAVVVASNVGATNGAYCKLGASATTSDQLIPPNSWFSFTVGANTQLTCITSTSTTTVNMVGGSGLPTGSGGGGGGGSGGAVTLASSAAVDCWSVTDGCKADAPATLPIIGTTPATEVALLKAIANAANSPAQLAINTTPTDCSSAIATGGTAQAAIAAQTTLHGFTIANIDSGHNDEVLWISFTTTAAASTAGSYPLPPPTATTFAAFGSYTTPPGFGSNHAVSVIGATSGHVYSCTFW